eukprot:203298-Prorocentrum_minimum.AAC.1
MFLGQCSVACRRSKSCKVIASLQTDPASDWKETVSNDFNYISKAHDKVRRLRTSCEYHHTCLLLNLTRLRAVQSDS